MVRICPRFLIAATLLCCLTASARDRKPEMHITTHSAKARAFFEEGLSKMETLHIQAGLQNWRDAAQADPRFALAHIFLCYFAQDPTEQVAEREKALATRPFAGPEEKLIVDWLANASQSHWVPAIQSMNEVLGAYPRDKHLAWLAGWWLLLGQNEPGRAIPMFERAISLDPQFADPWNEVAYCYARVGDFEPAFTHIKRYAELLPTEANPQDSYAEISRMAGRYPDALEHYRKSLQIDPTFIESQLGLGDTYALMGDEQRARSEYAIAIQKATKVQAALWSQQSAATYLREGNLSGADAAFQASAQQAHENDFGNLEAEAFRSMALYQKETAAAMSLLDKAEAALHESHKVPQALIDQELASVLRARVDRAVEDGNLERAAAYLQPLQDFANAKSDEFVQLAFHGAAGALYAAQGKYEDAISNLEEDARSPFSMRILAMAYQKNGDRASAERITKRLETFREPIIEQAVVTAQLGARHAESHAVKEPFAFEW